MRRIVACNEGFWNFFAYIPVFWTFKSLYVRSDVLTEMKLILKNRGRIIKSKNAADKRNQGRKTSNDNQPFVWSFVFQGAPSLYVYANIIAF